jgi:hypothetical protein
MGEHTPVLSTAKTNHPVTVMGGALAGPQPTTVGLRDPRPEPLLDWDACSTTRATEIATPLRAEARVLTRVSKEDCAAIGTVILRGHRRLPPSVQRQAGVRASVCPY